MCVGGGGRVRELHKKRTSLSCGRGPWYNPPFKRLLSGFSEGISPFTPLCPPPPSWYRAATKHIGRVYPGRKGWGPVSSGMPIQAVFCLLPPPSGCWHGLPPHNPPPLEDSPPTERATVPPTPGRASPQMAPRNEGIRVQSGRAQCPDRTTVLWAPECVGPGRGAAPCVVAKPVGGALTAAPDGTRGWAVKPAVSGVCLGGAPERQPSRAGARGAFSAQHRPCAAPPPPPRPRTPTLFETKQQLKGTGRMSAMLCSPVSLQVVQWMQSTPYGRLLFY